MAKDGGLYKRKKKEMEFFLEFPFLHIFPENFPKSSTKSQNEIEKQRMIKMYKRPQFESIQVNLQKNDWLF